ncbi:MAG TPA: PA2778 family cysteine peptidase [Burkholderiales bacterium]|nr:PA2778 family cysteine peptidase [Burkholderiales bacterium]
MVQEVAPRTVLRYRKARSIAGFLLLGALNGCALLAPPQYNVLKENRPQELPARVELKNVPFFAQEDYQCGPAAIAMAMNAAGVKVTPEQMVEQVYLPAKKGSLQIEMLVAPRRHGLVAYELAPQMTDVLREVAAGTPVIVLENYRYQWWPLWHYAVIIGYDLESGEVIRHSRTRERQTMPFPVFEYVWIDEGYWAMVVVPPDRVPVTATEERYGQAVAALEKGGDVNNAHIAYNAMLKRWPASFVGLMGLGNTAYAMKDLPSAETAFREAVQAHPEAPAAFNNLAHVLAVRGKFDEAVSAAERAVNLGGPLLPTAQATLEEIRKQTGTRTP